MSTFRSALRFSTLKGTFVISENRATASVICVKLKSKSAFATRRESLATDPCIAIAIKSETDIPKPRSIIGVK